MYIVSRNKQHSTYIPSSKAAVFILNLISCGGLTQVVYGVNRKNNGLIVEPFSLVSLPIPLWDAKKKTFAENHV